MIERTAWTPRWQPSSHCIYQKEGDRGIFGDRGIGWGGEGYVGERVMI